MAKKILIIEDDLSVVDYYRSIFGVDASHTSDLSSALDQIAGLLDGEKGEQAGDEYEITIATQGLNAIHEACKSRKQGDQFTHALVDMRLPPGIDGLETASCLREMNPEIGITFVTAYHDHEEKEIASVMKSNFRMISKPFSKEQILEAVA